MGKKTYTIDDKVADDFQKICDREGLYMSHQVNKLIEGFNKVKGINGRNKKSKT